jgi:hypothetical protein
MTVVVTDVVFVPVDALPGLSISPADTDTASVRLRIVTAHIWRKVVILVAPKHEIQKFCMHTRAAMNPVALRLRRKICPQLVRIFLASNVKSGVLT